MGSCISKCNLKKTSKRTHKNDPKINKEECKCQCIKQNSANLVQDKVIISQLPISSIKSPLPPSNSSPSRTNSNYPTTSSSSSSYSLLSSASSLASSTLSSTVSSKSGQSFSNDYLGSCAKQNPQVNHPNHIPIKGVIPKRSSLPKSHISGKKINEPKQLLPSPSPQRVVRPIAQKRPRCNSPNNLTRQKSFRRESEPESQSDKPVSISGRYSRPISPSTSRRFTRETSITQGRNVTNSMRRDNCYVRPTPSSRRTHGCSRRYGRSTNLLVKNEDGIKMVNSKIQELAIGGLSAQDVDMLPIEDAENHIALDCFIFL